MNNFRRGDAEFPPKPIDMTEPRTVVADICSECLAMSLDRSLPKADRDVATEVSVMVMAELVALQVESALA